MTNDGPSDTDNETEKAKPSHVFKKAVVDIPDLGIHWVGCPNCEDGITQHRIDVDMFIPIKCSRCDGSGRVTEDDYLADPPFGSAAWVSIALGQTWKGKVL